MLASAPRLNSADRPMNTSVLRQRRGSARKQHLGPWAWQRGRGQAVGTLHSGQQTERWQRSWRWVVERGITFQPLSLEIVRTSSSLTDRRPRIRIPRWRLFIRKKERGHGYNSSAATWQAMQNGGKNKNFPNNQNWNANLSSPSLLFKPQANQNYAGAKFSEPPSPSVLPKPPSHWVPVSFNPSDKEIMTFQLKTLLKVQV